MANATSIAVNALAANIVNASGTADAFDTGSAAVTVYTSAVNETDRLIFIVTNTAAENLVVAILAGDNPPAFRAGLGNLTSGNIAQNAIKVIGPLESARFLQDDGTVGMTLTPGGTIAANVRCYKAAKA